MRVKVIRPEAVDRDGPLILALTHLSHLDPFLACVVVRRRQIDWLARVEFFKYRIFEWFMRAMSAISVRRFGVSASAVRKAIERLNDGRVVGICPEGGVAQGVRTVMRGGAMRQGVCLLSCRTGVPVLPCIMLGTDKLNCVPPWIPFRRGRLYVAFGDSLVFPPFKFTGHETRQQRRAAWDAMTADLLRHYQSLFQETMKTFNIEKTFVP